MSKKWGAPRTFLHRLSVAVIGASKNPGKLGYHVMKSLTEGGFEGSLFAINRGETGLFGARAYPSLEDVPHDVDLAVVVLPAQAIPEVIQQCAAKGVRASCSSLRGSRRLRASGARSCSER